MSYRKPPLIGTEKYVLLEATRKVDEVMNKTEIGNITELNYLIYACTLVVTKMFIAKNRKSTGMEPWWKRRMEVQVKQLIKDLWHIDTLTERKNIKRKHRDRLERRNKTKRRGLPVAKEGIKERIKTMNNKIKRCQSRIIHYQLSRNFKNNQEKFYTGLNSGGRNYKATEIPDNKEAKEFWGIIREERKERQKDPE